MTRLTTCPDAETVAERAARHVERAVERALAERGAAHVALSGGTTPGRTYELLGGGAGGGGCAAGLPDVEWWFADERCVPPDHADSNYRMVRLALLDHVPAVVHRIEGERDPDAAAADYAAALPDVLDAMVLGMGEDLHTASLAPGVDWSRPTGQKVLHVSGFAKPPPDRITVTPDVIAAARALLVAVTGAGKAAQVALALDRPPEPQRYPIHLARRATWLLDRAAAAQLQESPHV